MFSKLGDWFRNFMMGRYGSDQLNVALLAAGIVMMVLGAILGRSFGLGQRAEFPVLCAAGVVYLPDVFPEYRRPPPGKPGVSEFFSSALRTASTATSAAPSAARPSASPGAGAKSISAAPGAANALSRILECRLESLPPLPAWFQAGFFRFPWFFQNIHCQCQQNTL